MRASSRRRDEARASATALDSAFRRRWSWSTRLRVTVLGGLVAIVLRLLYATLRVHWSDRLQAAMDANTAAVARALEGAG